MKEVLRNALEELHYGDPQIFRNMCVVPLLGGNGDGPEYITLKEGLHRKEVEIAEVSESGSVPSLRVDNHSELPLLLIDGEELAGAKQNRIVNTSLMLASRSKTRIPVSCTESGRWRYTSRRFADSGVIMSAKARYRKSARLLYNLKKKAAYNTEQAEVWRDIETLHSKHGSRSRTRAMKDAYLQRQQDMQDYLEAFPLLDGQCGLVVFHNGEVAGADFLSRSANYRHLHEKLLKSHVIEALSEKEKAEELTDWKLEARFFLHALLSAREVTSHQPVGLGEDLRYEGESNTASALVYGQTIIHLSAYAKAMAENASPDHRASEEEPPSTDRVRERLHRFRQAFRSRMFEQSEV